jgi:hypothetical protein
MAITVLTGASNPTYTNNTGQNVRVVINYAANVTGTNIAAVLSVSAEGPNTIGKNLAFTRYNINAANFQAGHGHGSNMIFSSGNRSGATPTDFILPAGQSFSLTCQLYNIIIIPENG